MKYLKIMLIIIAAAAVQAGNLRPFASHQPVPDLNAAIQREALPQPPADKNISWLVHRGGWGDSPAYGTRIDTYHYDQFQQDYSSGIDSEYRALKGLCNATFIQDFGDPRKLAAAAAANGMNYAVMNTLSPLAMSAKGIKTPDDCVAYLVKQTSVCKDVPGYCNIDGKLLVFVFDVSGFTPDEWKPILQKTRDAFPDRELLFIGERSVFAMLSRSDPQAYMTGVLDAFDGIMFWSSYTEKKLENLKMARQAMRTLGKQKLVFWVASSGYWRPEKGMFVDARGTKVWRDQLELCFKNNFDGLMIESWNDLEENTQVTPGREAGGVVFELLKYYSAVSNHREYVAKDPGLLLTHPREILAGGTLDIEVLSLPVKSPRKTFRLELDDEQGMMVYLSPEQSVPPDSAEAFNFAVPTRSLSGTGRLEYRIVADGKIFQTGSWTTLRASRMESPWFQGVVLGDIIQPNNISFDLKSVGGLRTADIHIKHDTPLSRVDIYRNGQPVWSLDAARLDRSREWSHGPVALELDFQMPFVSEETKNRRGILTVNGGTLVRGFDKMGRSLVTAPDSAQWDAPPTLGHQFNVKLLVDANDETRFSVELPAYGQTFDFTLGELRQQKRIEKQQSAHGRVWIQEFIHPLLWQVEAGALGTNVDETVALNPVGENFENEYVLWVMDANGQSFRSQPVTVFSKVRKGSDDQWLWDESARERFSAPVPRTAQTEAVWSFDGSPSRVYDDEQGSGVTARLGGGMYRCGHFEPDAVPSVVDRDGARALHFDGGDYVQFDAGAFPQGAFELGLDVCPETLSTNRQTLFFSRLNLVLFLTSDGRVGAQFKGLAEMPQPQELLSADKLPLNQWSHVNVRYDYQTLTLDVNGTVVSVPLAKGPDRDISAESYLGAEVEGAETTSARRFFTGGLDNLKIRCGILADQK
jgi:hypothetical protein